MNPRLDWLRANLFSSVSSALATLAIAWLALKMLPPLIDWAFVDAVWQAADSQSCRAASSRPPPRSA